MRLMICITTACRPATPAACWEPNSLRGLRSVSHAPVPPLLPPTCISSSIGYTLRSNDRCLAPPRFSHLSPCSSAVGLPLLSDASVTPRCVGSCTHSDTHTLTPPSLPTTPPFRDGGAERCLIYNQGGNAPMPSPPPPPPLPSRCEH